MSPNRKRARKGNPGGGRYRKGSTTLGPEQQQRFLDSLAEGWSPTKAAEAAKAPRTTFRDLRDRDPTFRARWDAAHEAGTDHLEDAAVTRGIVGWLEPVYQQGRKVGEVRKFSDTMLAMQLNGRRPDKYRQNVKVDAPDLAVSFRAAMAEAAKGTPAKANGHDASHPPTAH